MTHVIDREGRWRANFYGLKFEPTNLVLFINALVNDVHDAQGNGELSAANDPLIGGIVGAVSLTLATGVILFYRTRRKRTG